MSKGTIHVHGHSGFTGGLPDTGRADAFPQDGTFAHVVPVSFDPRVVTPLMVPAQRFVGNEYAPAQWASPSPSTQGVAWLAWKWLVQLACAGAALGVAVEGQRHTVPAAAAAVMSLVFMAHFALIDALRFRGGANGLPIESLPGMSPSGGWSAPMNGNAATTGWSSVPPGIVMHRQPMVPGSQAGRGMVAASERVSVVPPAGMPVAGRWSFVAPDIEGQAPANSGAGSASRSSVRSGRLR